MIGFFDSGLGGYTVVREYRKLRPDDEILYTADWDYCPYGGKPPGLVAARARHITGQLIERGARVIVAACNTATAIAIDSLRADFPHASIVGMEPAVKPALLATKTGVIGVLATANTFTGRLYKETSAKFGHGVKIVAAVGEGLVELVESGAFDGPPVRAALERCLRPMLDAGADQIVLGCTHYAFLKTAVAEIAGPATTIHDTSRAVAERAAALMAAGSPS